MSTYVPIQAITVSAGTTTINFTGVPQTFTDLVIVANLRGNNVNTSTGIRFNSDTATNYSLTGMSGEGANPISYRNTTSDRILLVSGSANWNSTWGTILINIPNYTNTTTNKTVLIRSGSSNGEVVAHAGVWRKTPEAITSITIFAPAGSWAADTTFTLYGIGSGAPKAFGGSEVRTDGTYWYHIFNASGTFTPFQNLTCDYLVIAGGGAGGRQHGGGGGAGGYRTSVGTSGANSAAESALNLLANTAYTVTIGAGGTAIADSNNRGPSGSNSTFSTITSTGGGGGGTRSTVVSGGNGGSGGGGGYAGAGGTGTALQGLNGGTDTNGMGAGGGGASTAGSGTTSTKGGNGGSGIASTISGTSVTRAGGGGGGTQGAQGDRGLGTGGGGDGGWNGGNGTSATANTGGGGGGGGNVSTLEAGNGGSGIVIVRYAV